MKPDTLTMTEDEMRDLGYRVIDMLVDHWTALADKKVANTANRQEMEKALSRALPESGRPAEEILEEIREHVFSHLILSGHPRFFAYIPSPNNFVSAVAAALISGFNPYAGLWLEGAGPAQIELNIIAWLAREMGLPESAGGLFVSGGSMANLTALAAARHVRLGEDFGKGVVYFSDQTHYSVEKGLSVLGLRHDQIRKIPSDDAFRLSTSELQSAVEEDRMAGRIPFCVIANAGTTNTGTVDPLPALADFCRREGIWFHVDGAFGAGAMLCDRGKALLQGLDRVDSLSVDPHKWMFQPYEMGCVLVRDRRDLKAAFRVMPEYLKDADLSKAEVNFCDYGIQLTRSFRALKLWMSLNVFGVEAYRRAVDRGFTLADFAYGILKDYPVFKIVTQPEMAVITFRYTVPGQREDDIDTLNERIVERVIQDGLAMITSTTLKGRKVLRMCTINPRTTEEDIRLTVEHIKEVGDHLSAT
jgi:aromatic-L-amino-acid decarboxylase